MIINVREFLGEKINAEDAIILRGYLEEILDNNENDIELDFIGLERISTTFLTCLFTNLINKVGRQSIIEKINVKNLSNNKDYSRVVRGTSFN